ncbi:MAG: radical SAM protein, partial [Pyrinomonadaceae bacterium]
MEFSFDPELNYLVEKVENGERLTFAEGVVLYKTKDLNALGKLADTVRRKKHGRTTYYNVNRHFNHTNICVADCKFCGFYKRAREEGAYTHSITDAIEIARTAVAEGATELHIVGGLNSKLPFAYYTDLFSSLKREFPKLHLKALTMVELDFFARFYKMSDEDVIEKLHAAGMDSCPGGGAEIFAE